MKNSTIRRAALRLAALLLLSCTLTVVGAGPVRTAPVLRLWEDAVSSAARSAVFLPGSIYTEVTVGDAKGDIKTSQRTWSRLSIGKKGAVVATVLRSLKNGRNNTEEAQTQLDRHPERGQFDTSLLPMMPSNQEKVDVSPTGRSRTISGERCTGFSYRMRGKGSRSTVGTVWLDERTGVPVLLEFTFDPLPPGATVIEDTLHFEAAPGRIWHLASLDTHAEGRVLFFERTFRLHMVFSNYFRYSPPADAASGASH